MAITKISIHHFRNMAEVSLELSPKMNFFFGENGSGKTSLIESIYYLGFGRSFRTHLTPRLIQHDQADFVIYAEFNDKDDTPNRLGLERARDGSRKIHLNGESLTSMSEIAKLLPLQLMTTTSYRYFHDGPKLRRQYLDWGTFHVEHTFYPLWKQLQHCLKQRNAALKMHSSPDQLSLWDNQLADIGEQIDKIRKHYIDRLSPIAEKLFSDLLGDSKNIHLRYRSGWNKELALIEALERDYERDLNMGYTHSGPQRADLQVYIDNVPVGDKLSQGQQKIAAHSLHLAQGILHKQLTERAPIYLIDDLASELDTTRFRSIIDVIISLDSQIILTGIDQSQMDDFPLVENVNVFHVKHGNINELIEKGTANAISQ